MKLLARFLPALLLILANAVDANTEKAIFLGPDSVSLASFTTKLNGLSIATLTPSQPKLSTSLPVAFPTADQPRGLEAWYILDFLNRQQRYEVRICWAATQPTEFWLGVFTIPQFLDDAALFQQFTRAGQNKSDQENATTGPAERSVLLLRVQSAADFFTANQTLMSSPPPVDVDIILDPYIANIFPASLVSTAIYILCLALGSWLASRVIWSALSWSRSAGKAHSD